MSTKMDEDDWAHTLAVFRACLPRRGRKAKDDPPLSRGAAFLHRQNVRWRALPERFGPWNSVWKRFDRLEQRRRVRGVLRHARLDEFHGASHSDVQLDHRARACVGGRGERGQEGQALGRSRGGFTTKIHAKSDASGDIIAFDLTGGEASDARHFGTLLDIGPDIQPRAVICDKGYASKANRDAARARGIAPAHTAQGQRKEQAGLLRPHPLQGPRPHRAGRRQAQAIQARRPTLRKDRTQLRSIVSFAAGPLLDQIRPHGLGFAGWRTSARTLDPRLRAKRRNCNTCGCELALIGS